MVSKHVAASGASAGQWVTCNATGACRLGGTHISERELYATRAWLKEDQNESKNNSQITAEDVTKYQESTKGNTEEWNKKAELIAVKEKGLTKNFDAQVFKGEENLVERKAPEMKKFVPYSGKSSVLVDRPEVQDYIQTGNFEGVKKILDDGSHDQNIIKPLSHLRLQHIENTPLEKLEFTEKNTENTVATFDIPEVKKYMETGDENSLYTAERKYHLGQSVVDRISKHRKTLKGDTSSTLKSYDEVRKTPEAQSYFENGDMDGFRKITSTGNLDYHTISELKKVRDYRLKNNPLEEVRFTNTATGNSYATFDIPEVKAYLRKGNEDELVFVRDKYDMPPAFVNRLKAHRSSLVTAKQQDGGNNSGIKGMFRKVFGNS